MAYRSVIQDIPLNLKRTLLGTFDFRGRSTRTEFLTYLIVPNLVVGIGLLLVTGLFKLDVASQIRLQNAAELLLFVPLVALLTRRLHDQDRSAWWLMLLAATAILTILSDNGYPYVPGITKLETPWWIDMFGIPLIISIWVLSLLPPTPEANRYGPNPRLDEPVAPS